MLPFLPSLMPTPALYRVLRDRLAHMALFSEISEAALKRILVDASWFGLSGGAHLSSSAVMAGDALFVVLSGGLGVFAGRTSGSAELVAQITPGEITATVVLEDQNIEFVALRDTEILRIGPMGFEVLVVHRPKIVFDLMRGVVKRLARPPEAFGPRSNPKVFALVPFQDGLEEDGFVERLAAALRDLGAKVGLVDRAVMSQPSEWFAAFEASHDFVLYRGDHPDSQWTQTCVRQADRVYLLARSDKSLPAIPLNAAKQAVCGPPELVLLHMTSICSVPEYFSRHQGCIAGHHHIRKLDAADISRLARSMAGLAVGVVLSGGAARGFAHIGVLKALFEAKVPLDYFGGVSMGAIVAAGLAAGWSIEELTERMREAFVAHNPLSDFTLPMVALVKGRKMTRLLTRHFGKVRIENLQRPFFCVSADLTAGHVHEHRSGALWRALRASAAIPGIIPPVIARGHLLVDGGVMNNLPVDIMAKTRLGTLIASDVTEENEFAIRPDRAGQRTLWRGLWQRMRGMPSIFDILMRTGTMGSEAQRRLARNEADILFEPPMPGLNPLDWKSFDRAIAQGYAHAADIIAKNGVPKT